MKVKIKNTYKLPEYGTKGAACVDLCLSEDVRLPRGKTVTAKTGVKVQIPSGYCLLIFERSSTHNLGIQLANKVGVIDSDYRGEIKLRLQNIKDYDIALDAGISVAQMMLQKVEHIEWECANQLNKTDRLDDGFGSTSHRVEYYINGEKRVKEFFTEEEAEAFEKGLKEHLIQKKD